MRDSLSALDQAIACCGNKLNAADVRALLGAFSIELLEKITGALADGDSRRMLEVVDELERNGQNLQHFSRELARYFRNLLVARISGRGDAPDRGLGGPEGKAGGDRRADSPKRISRATCSFRWICSAICNFAAAAVSSGDRAGRAWCMRDACCPSKKRSPQLDTGVREPPPAPAPRVAAPPPPRVAPPRTGPSPFELDRAKKSGGSSASRTPEPQSSGANALAPQPSRVPETVAAGDWRQKLHAALMELGMPFTADAVENARIAEVKGELRVTASKGDSLALRPEDLNKAVAHITGREMRIRIIIGDPGETVQPIEKPVADEDAATSRALSNPEVQRFREVFGGEIRKVRNLKE